MGLCQTRVLSPWMGHSFGMESLRLPSWSLLVTLCSISCIPAGVWDSAAQWDEPWGLGLGLFVCLPAQHPSPNPSGHQLSQTTHGSSVRTCACCRRDPVCLNCSSSFPIPAITFPIRSPIAEHPELWDVSAGPQNPSWYLWPCPHEQEPLPRGAHTARRSPASVSPPCARLAGLHGLFQAIFSSQLNYLVMI